MHDKDVNVKITDIARGERGDALLQEAALVLPVLGVFSVVRVCVCVCVLSLS